MIDFTKKINKIEVEKSDNPLDIYNGLDRTNTAGPLYRVQEKVLTDWYNNRINDGNCIVKLQTGEGKTLVGLMMLLTYLNRGEGPCVYICPNIYLVEQVCQEACKFGIPICTIGAGERLPDEFLSGKRILITHVQKMINGKTIFGRGNNYTEVGALVLDDAHACTDSIREAFVMSIKRDEDKELYNALLTLFDNELAGQREGTLWDIKNNSTYDSVMMIPYWAWIEKKSQVIEMLAKNENAPSVSFVWPIIKDIIERCQAFVNGHEIQIMPVVSSIKMFGSFSMAKHKVLMSATTQNDYFFVETLDIPAEVINNPLTNDGVKWHGEKMILLPELISERLTRDVIIEGLGNRTYRFGTIALTPSRKKQDSYREYNCILVDKENIAMEIDNLKKGNFGKMIVVANRYDGIDLPDQACRILLLDSLPYFSNMNDTYEENARRKCEIIRRKIVQKIEQGLGRCVRGEKDYSCILLIGSELVNFVRNSSNRKLFSNKLKSR